MMLNGNRMRAGSAWMPPSFLAPYLRRVLAGATLAVAAACGGGGGGGGRAAPLMSGIWTFQEVVRNSNCGPQPHTLLNVVTNVLVAGGTATIVTPMGTFTGTAGPGSLAVEGAFREAGGWTHFSLTADVADNRLEGTATWEFGQDPTGANPECTGTSDLVADRRTTPFVPAFLFVKKPWSDTPDPWYPEDGSDVFVADLAGLAVPLAGERVNGHAVQDVGLTPDRRWVAYDAAGRLYVVPSGGGLPVDLGVVTRWGFAPSGDVLAYTRPGTPQPLGVNNALFLVDPDGGQPRQIPTPGAWVGLWEFSPDGSWLALNGYEERIVGGNATYYRTLFAAATDGSGLNRLYDQQFNEEVLNVDWLWSPDASRLAFNTGVRTGFFDWTPVGLWSVRPNGTQLAQVSTTTDWAGDYTFAYAWAPDGIRFAYQADGDADLVVDTFVAPAAGGPSFKAVSPPPGETLFLHGWSASGTWLSHTLPGPTPPYLSGLFVAAADGSSTTEVVPAGVRSSVTWSPSGARIAFVRGALAGPEHLFAWSPGDASPSDLSAPLAWSNSVDSFHWLPAGDRVAFSDGVGRVAIAAADASTVLEVAPGQTPKTIWNFTQDGQRIFFAVPPSSSSPAGIYTAAVYAGTAQLLVGESLRIINLILF